MSWLRWLVVLGCFTGQAVAGLPLVDPATCGMKTDKLREMEPLIAQALADKKMPGCVVAVGRKGSLVWLKSYGLRQVLPTAEPMTVDTIFDLASLTKPIATGTSMMLLLEQGRFQLDDPVVKVIPEFAAHGKDVITFQQLLIHQSGLIADNAMADYRDGPEKAFERIHNLALQSPVGQKFVYSDVNFIVLGEAVQKLSGQSVHEFTREKLFLPLGMQETTYLPPAEWMPRIAPTGPQNGTWIKGQVHDPRAAALEGVAGHAGLFSTANDLAIYAQMMLNGGTYNGQKVLSPETVATMTRSYPVSTGTRGLGWDKQSSYSGNKGTTLSTAAFGHGGFTGTVLWIDPAQELFFIFLSNRLHPDGKGSVNPLAGQIATFVGEAVVKTEAQR